MIVGYRGRGIRSLPPVLLSLPPLLIACRPLPPFDVACTRVQVPVLLAFDIGCFGKPWSKGATFWHFRSTCAMVMAIQTVFLTVFSAISLCTEMKSDPLLSLGPLGDARQKLLWDIVGIVSIKNYDTLPEDFLIVNRLPYLTYSRFSLYFCPGCTGHASTHLCERVHRPDLLHVFTPELVRRSKQMAANAHVTWFPPTSYRSAGSTIPAKGLTARQLTP
jgi:hypothetical protein